MKILLLNVDCKYSSTGKIVYDLYTNLRKKGHQVAVCYGRGEKIVEPNIYKFGLDWETYLHAALARITGLNGYFSPFSTRRLIKFIDEFKPDIIHIHELHAYFVNVKPLLQYIKQKGIKVVWTFHCEYVYTGKCGHAYECEKWKTECGNCPAVKEYPKSLFVDGTKFMFKEKKRLLQDLDMTIVTPSKWLADRVKQSFLGNKNIKVINNGIDTNIFNICDIESVRQEYGIGKEKKVVLFVAPNLNDPNKGVKWVIRLCEKMEEVLFVIVGEGKVETECKNVVFTGKIKNQRKLASIYSMADVLISCSKRETFPTTCIEAQSCGTPVAGFVSGGAQETSLLSKETFVQYGDVDELQSIIVELLMQQINKTRLSKEASFKYARETMVQSYLEIYESD